MLTYVHYMKWASQNSRPGSFKPVENLKIQLGPMAFTLTLNCTNANSSLRWYNIIVKWS